jgi:hypothetical protein
MLERDPVAVGWQAFSDLFRGMGIGISPDALETRRRRYGLPPHESVRGRPVPFTQGHLERWVLHLTGLELDLWTRQHRRARNARIVLHPRRRGPQLATRGVWLPVPVFAVTLLEKRGEVILRESGGRSHWGFNASLFGSRIAALDLEDIASPQPRVWRYDRARFATASDLHEPRYAHRRKREQAARPANVLIVALTRKESRWSVLLAPGEWFSCTPGTSTHFIVSTRQAGFADLCARMRAHRPDTTFVAFSRRAELDPVTLDILGASLPATGANVLREPPAN